MQEQSAMVDRRRKLAIIILVIGFFYSFYGLMPFIYAVSENIGATSEVKRMEARNQVMQARLKIIHAKFNELTKNMKSEAILKLERNDPRRVEYKVILTEYNTMKVEWNMNKSSLASNKKLVASSQKTIMNRKIHGVLSGILLLGGIILIILTRKKATAPESDSVAAVSELEPEQERPAS